jgi:hypothetical protein
MLIAVRSPRIKPINIMTNWESFIVAHLAAGAA